MSMVSASKYAQYGVAVILVLHISMLVVTRSVVRASWFFRSTFWVLLSLCSYSWLLQQTLIVPTSSYVKLASCQHCQAICICR